MTYRTKKILAWIGGIIGALLIAAVVWGYFYVYKPVKLFGAMVDNNQAEVIRLIDEEGYDPNMKLAHYADVFTLYLFYKPESASAEIAEILLERGLKLNSDTSFKSNTLIRAIDAKQPEIVKFLLEKGFDPNTYCLMNNKKVSVLESALLPYQPKMAALLLSYDANFADFYNDDRIIFRAVTCVEQKICPPSLLDKLRHKGISQETINEYQEKYLLQVKHQ